MLAEASRYAAAEGIMNVRWVQSVAEELPGVAPGPYRLVTFGQSFHWTQEDEVAETVFDLLEPCGAMAMVVHTVKDRPRPSNPGHPVIPHDELATLSGSIWARPNGLGTDWPRPVHIVSRTCS